MVKSRSYTLYTEKGGWLGQIVLTEDGMFASVTDYGNLSYTWRSTGDNDFRRFILGLNTDYFASKMVSGMAYIAYNKKIEIACLRFAGMILPTLKQVLQKDLEENPNW